MVTRGPVGRLSAAAALALVGVALAALALRSGGTLVGAGVGALGYAAVVPALAAVVVLAGAVWTLRRRWGPVTPWLAVAWVLGGLALGPLVVGSFVFAQAAVGVAPATLVVAIGTTSAIGAALGSVLGRVDVARREADVDRRRELRRLDEFARVVSHDLRNPLAVATGRLELARDEADSPHLEAVARSHDRMAELIEELLDPGRDGGTGLPTEPVALAGLVEACWSQIDSGGAALIVETDAVVRADPARLRQLLENLFRNAVEHGSTSPRPGAGDAVEHGSTSLRLGTGDPVEHGPGSHRARADGAGTDDAGGTGGALSVTVGDLEDDPGFFVADDGPGVPPALRERAFEDGVTSTAGGTGVGLGIVRQVAEVHDWEVRLGDRAGGGTRVEVRGVERVA